MEATAKDLQGLQDLQQVDIILINTQKKLEELPQREQLQQLAQKKQAVVAKQAQVGKMYDAACRKSAQLEDEMAILEGKQASTQEKIEDARGDFRAVQSFTRDLEGIAKRMATLEGEQLAATEKFEQVDGVKAQVEKALAALDAQALQLRESYQQDATALHQQIQKAQAERNSIAASIDVSVLREYQVIAKRCGGLGVAVLNEGKCSVCRNALDANRMLIAKREAPLSTCPSCRRLLIVG